MALTLAAEIREQARGGIRPLDPARDLGAVADLVGEAFSDELDSRARAALRDMRWMARLSPLVWWWAQVDPDFRESFSGFVWEEPVPGSRRRRIVGNVSLNRAPGSRRHWIVCNVVVHPDYRRQGIARRLAEAAIEQAQRFSAEGVLLQVYRDNTAALDLYLDLGFRELGGETTWRLPEVKGVAVRPAPGYEIRPWRPADGPATYDLARRALSPAQQWLVPARPEVYQPGLWDRLEQGLGNWLAGREVERLVACAGPQLAALITVTFGTRQPAHQLSLLVHPDHRGALEAPLLNQALFLLADGPTRPVWLAASSDDVALSEALRAFGFDEQRTLLTLGKDLD